MSELLKRIKKDQLHARKQRDTKRATFLTTLIGEASPSGNDTVTDNDVQSVIIKFKKNATEVLNIKMSRNEDTGDVQNEISFMDEYLPKMLTKDEIDKIVESVIEANDINSPKGLGIIMGHFSKNHKGQFDGKELKSLVTKKLST